MNSILQIQIRVIARDAQAQIAALQGQIGALEARLRRLNGAMASNASAAGGFAGALNGIGNGLSAAGGGLFRFSGFLGTVGSSLIKFGKNIQWTGRQLEYRFTLPVVAAGYLVTKMVLENEKAMTRLRKVYGSGSESAKQITTDIKGLEQAFYALSNIFGVSMKQVTEIGAFWAQAGATGVTLAKATRATLETMILGEMQAEEAATSLIAVMTQYGFTADQLRLAMAQLNTTENETAVGFKDLIDVFTRSGGAARTAGVDVRHLAAMTAAIVPAAGTAEMAGTGLKTMLARIMVPTERAADAFAFLSQRLGVDITDSANSAVKRLELTAQAMEGLTPAQRAMTAEMIAGKWQINRFDMLLRDIVNPLGNYQKVLSATADDTKVLATYQRELGIYLSSTPQAFAILKTQMQNMLAKIMIPLMPAILGVMTRIRNLVEWFTKLSPAVQQTIILGFVLLAVLGPIISYLGAFIIVGGMVLKMVLLVGQGFSLLGGVLLKTAGAMFRFAGSMFSVLKSVVPVLAQILTWVVTYSAQVLFVIAKYTGLILLRTVGWMIYLAVSWVYHFAAVRATVLLGWAQIAAIYIAGWARTIATTVAGWATHFAITVTGWARTAAITVAGWARTAAITVAGWARIAITTVTGWATTLAANVVYWARSIAITVLGWAQTAALYVVGWVRIAAVTIAGWARVAAVTVAGWATQLAVTVAGWARSAAVTVVGWATQLALTVAGWAQTAAIYVAGWVGIVATAVAGWAKEYLVWVAGKALRTALVIAAWAQDLAIHAAGYALRTAMAISAHAKEIAVWLAGKAALLAAEVAKWAGLVAINIVGWMGIESAAVTGGVALVAAVGIALFLLRKQVMKAFGWIKEHILAAWHALPAGVQAAFGAVFRILNVAIKKVREWLSYLNPFARHSPSLVEQVTKGVDLIARKYASLSNIGSVFRKAIDDLKAFKDATQAAVDAQDAAKFGEARAATVAAAPNSGAAFDATYASMRTLQSQLGPLQAEIDLQAMIVGAWSAELETAKTALDNASNSLSVLKDQANALKNSLDLAESNMKRFAEAPITGMKAMNEAIWQNEYAQNQLNLQLKLMEQQGISIDKIKNKMSSLQGEIENVMGNREELRLAGAGSDVLATLDAQIASMKASKDALGGQAQQVQSIVTELDRLNLEGEVLKLQQSVTFDPLMHQIDLLMDKQQEMNFDEIVAGVQKYSAEMDVLAVQYEQASAAVEAQQAVVDGLQTRHDAILAVYDAEKAKLDELTDAYSNVEQQINDMTAALEQFTLARSGAGGGAGGDGLGIGDLTNTYDIPGGPGGGILNEPGDIMALADQWSKEMEKSFGSFDLFKPLREQWDKWFQWTKDKISGFGKSMNAGITHALGGLTKDDEKRLRQARKELKELRAEEALVQNRPPANASADAKWQWKVKALMAKGHRTAFESEYGDLLDKFDANLEKRRPNGIMKWRTGITDAFKGVMDSPVGKWVTDTMGSVWREIQRAGKIIGKELKKWGKLAEPFTEALGHIWNVTKVVLGVLLALWNACWPTIKSVFIGVWRVIVDVIKGALEFIRGLIMFVLGVINLDWGQMWDGIKTMFAGIWDAIFGIVRFALDLIWQVIQLAWDGILWVIKWTLGVIWDCIKDIFTGIWSFIVWVWNAIWNTIKTVASGIWDGIKWVFNGIKDTVTSVFDKVVGFFTELPGKIMGAIGAIASAAAGVGSAIWNGITGGLSAAGGFISDVAGGIWGSVKNFLNDKVFDPIRGFKVSFFGHDFKPFGSIPRLAQGGVVGARAGGQMALLGEAGRREAVIPLPSGFSLSALASTMTRIEKMASAMATPTSTNAKNEIHFHGDLSFPNIKSGEDAEAFIRNLESLAE